MWTADRPEIQYLMQFQSDILDRKVLVPDAEELSGIGAAYAAGRGLGLYGDEVFTRLKRREYAPKMCEDTTSSKVQWMERCCRPCIKINVCGLPKEYTVSLKSGDVNAYCIMEWKSK